ncbi:protein phosphatase 2C domain-containing protein [Candidatus Woesearchaeota archaeon]|nr:protein phosphatase 2C domain-containing protein [Candidatus Woesearchaeota archaeon]
MKYKLNVYVRTSKAMQKEQTENQDATYKDKDCCIGILSDGMGGISGGYAAGKIVTESGGKKTLEMLSNLQNSDEETIKSNLLKILQEVNNEVIENLEAGGATVEHLVKVRDEVYVGHAGDSSVYAILDDWSIQPITEKDTNIQEMIQRGKITKEEAAELKIEPLISQHIGKENCKFKIYKRKLEGVRYLVALTDGAEKRIASLKEIVDYAKKNSSGKAIANKIEKIMEDPKVKAQEIYDTKMRENPDKVVWIEEIKEELKDDDATAMLYEVLKEEEN